MTYKEKLIARAVDHGMWEDEANKAFDLMLVEATFSGDMASIKWNGDEGAYPPQMAAIVWMTFKAVALKMLKRDKPEHFAIAILGATP